jgi:hypothetical protein
LEHDCPVATLEAHLVKLARRTVICDAALHPGAAAGQSGTPA